MKKYISIVFTLLISLSASAQDLRTLETKVADILARMPVYDQETLESQMKQMTDLGNDGWQMICEGIVEPGSGDDTRSRFLIESYSRYLSSGDSEDLRMRWESMCVSFITISKNIDVKRFFFSQLKMVGSYFASDFALDFIDDPGLADPALDVIELVGDMDVVSVLESKLRNPEIKTAASIMNTLAEFKELIGVDVYLYWYNNGTREERIAALNALAMGARPEAQKTLSNAARSADFSWDPDAPVEAYLNYASELAKAGNNKTARKICTEVIKKTNDHSIQYKIYALTLLAEMSGVDAAGILAANFEDRSIQYRKHALALAEKVEGEAATKMYLKTLTKLEPEYVSDLILMLGNRGDKIAVSTIRKYLGDPDSEIRMAAAESMVNMLGTEAAGDLISFMRANTELAEQEHVFSLYSRIADPAPLDLLTEAYPELGSVSKAFTLMILAEGGNNKFFDLILSETDSNDDLIRNAAFVSLKKLAINSDIPVLLELLQRTVDKGEITQVQSALASAANQISIIEKRADLLIEAAQKSGLKPKLIPVLKNVGGREALSLVLDNFYNGEPGIKEICFDALAGWRDFSAAYALFEICSKDNQDYFRPAFEGFIRQVSNADITQEQKLLLLRKIMPYAKTPDQKVQVLGSISNIHTLPALFFADDYFDDSVINQVAVRSAMQIALPSGGRKEGLYGKNVEQVLLRVIELIKGEGAEYDIERIKNYLNEMPEEKGFVSMFNGKDLEGWQGLVENPIARSKMSSAELAQKQKIADTKMLENWSVKDGAIWFSGKGANLCSVKEYSDFEMLVDWRITKEGDSGIYLRGTPQVQIWDTSRVEVGAQVGSGGLYNNTVNESHPLKVADNPVGDWNSFRIVMIGERVSVWLNGELVVDNVIMENYWDRSIPIFPSGAIELQAHGNELAFRDIYVREINSKEYNLSTEEKAEGFESLFNGKGLSNWIGDKESYVVEDGVITVQPGKGSGGNLFTEKEYKNFNFRFEFKLTPGANNGLGIRAPLEGDAAYVGMELQILDNRAEIYANLQPYQYHGSVYGVIPAKRGFLKPISEWNEQEVIVRGTRIKIILNGEVIVDGDIAEARENGTMDKREHPGLRREKGHIGFLGHGSVVYFRNIRIKELD